jgi:hypothetical protein
VNIGKQTVTVFLDDDGQAILQAAAVPISLDSSGMLVDVIETDDLGIWIQNAETACTQS